MEGKDASEGNVDKVKGIVRPLWWVEEIKQDKVAVYETGPSSSHLTELHPLRKTI